MKFEELESLWNAQPALAPLITDVAAMKRALRPELNRRSRMLGYELAATVFAVLALPVLSVANYLHDPARYGAVWDWMHSLCQMGVAILFLVHVARRFRHHRALRRQPMGSLREMTLVSVANLEAEMRGYRWQQPVLWLMAATMVTAIIRSGLRHGWETGLAAGLSTALLLAVVMAVQWRHYVVNVRPAWLRQREILRELE